MDCDIIPTESSVTVPTSHITFAGAPFLYKRFPEHNQPAITPLQSLMEEFKTKTKGKAYYLDDVFGTPVRKNVYSLDFKIKRYSSDETANRPGEMKRSSDEDAELIRLSQKILSLFKINLVIHNGPSQSRKIQNVLKFLIPEICLFPLELFTKLQLHRLFFCGEGQDSIEQSSSVEINSFNLPTIETPLMVAERLYQIISIHLSRQCKEEIADFEKDFIGLMKSTSHTAVQGKFEEIKKWLSKQNLGLTEEWFKNRNSEKKKIARVSFCF